MKIYLVGALKNPNIPLLGNTLRNVGFEVFDDWWGAGPEADDYWQQYENTRGRSYYDALHGDAAENIFAFDLHHLTEANLAVLMLPAGKSAHMEFGFMVGQGRPGYVLFDTVPERYDLMYRLAKGIFFDQDELVKDLEKRWIG